MKKGILLTWVLQFISLSVFAQEALKDWEKAIYFQRQRQGGGNIQAYNKPAQAAASTQNGTYTGLTGFCDFQINGGSPKYIAINPANPKHIHVTCMTAGDAGNVGGTRRVGYAYSSDGGMTWTSIGSIGGTGTVEKFPSLALLPNRSSNTVAAIACTATPEPPERSVVFIDQLEGTGTFLLTSTDTTGFSNSQLAWPSLLANKDGSKMWLMATNPFSSLIYYTLWDNTTKKFSSCIGPLKTTTGSFLSGGGTYGMAISASGNKVAMVNVGFYNLATNPINYTKANISFSESTNGGQSFPDFTNIMPYPTVARGDTLFPWVGCDAVYVGETLHIVFSSGKFLFSQGGNPIGVDIKRQGIWHWSEATGFTNVVDTTKIKAVFGRSWEGDKVPGNGLSQFLTLPTDYPSAGTGPDGSLFCVFQAARREKSKDSFNYYTVLYTRSTDGGLTWSAPVEIEQDVTTDFRYPSVAKNNPADEVNVAYQKDTEPGSGAKGEATVTEAPLIYAKLTLDGQLGADDDPKPKPDAYRLEQNYPNPFNPSTVIPFSLPKSEQVELTVYDLLGRRVAVLLNERKPAGSHQVTFNPSRLASGIYFYRLRAGSFLQTKKMVFLR